MKKVILATILFASVFGYSQDLKFGLKGGLNISTLNTYFPTIPGATTSLSNVVGGNFGIYVDYKISDKFSLQPELLFSMQGAKASLKANGESLSETLNLKYLNVPIIAKYYATEKFSIQAGPQIGFLIAANDKIDSSITDIHSESSNIKSDLKSIDFGLNFGLGYEFTEKISVSTRYNLGLNQIQKTVTTDSSSSKNRVISIGIEYKF